MHGCRLPSRKSGALLALSVLLLAGCFPVPPRDEPVVVPADRTGPGATAERETAAVAGPPRVAPGPGAGTPPASAQLTLGPAVANVAYNTPSPIGAALPGLVEGGAPGNSASLSLHLDPTSYRYIYACGATMCEGTAPGLWRALSVGQKRAYFDALLTGLDGAFPGRLPLIVALSGRDQVGPIIATAQIANGQRFYAGL